MNIIANRISNFWSYVDKTDKEGCWVWLGSRNPQWHYGSFWMGVLRKMQPAHRVSYEFAYLYKPTPQELVLHSCDNPPCVRPSHLWLGTDRDNYNDAVAKGKHFNTWSKDLSKTRSTFRPYKPRGATKGIQ